MLSTVLYIYHIYEKLWSALYSHLQVINRHQGYKFIVTSFSMLLTTNGNKVLRATHRSRLQETQALHMLTTLPVLAKVKKMAQVNRTTSQ